MSRVEACHRVPVELERGQERAAGIGLPGHQQAGAEGLRRARGRFKELLSEIARAVHVARPQRGLGAESKGLADQAGARVVIAKLSEECKGGLIVSSDNGLPGLFEGRGRIRGGCLGRLGSCSAGAGQEKQEDGGRRRASSVLRSPWTQSRRSRECPVRSNP